MPPLAAVPDLDHELDALYGRSPEEFTKARNDLVARLKKAHQAEAAETVRSLRKPTVVVWASNQLARSRPDLVAELVDAGGRLRTVQQRALAGREPQSEVAAAAEREREAVRALVGVARARLGERATPQLLDRVSQTLRAAAVDHESATLLAAGRLSEELHPVGFGPLEAVAPRRRAQAGDARAKRERLKVLRTEANRLAADARRAEDAAAEAEREASRLRQEAARAAAEAERAATALAEAEETV